MIKQRIGLSLLVAGGLVLLSACAAPGPASADDTTSPRWWKGNTHTHTLWSDGDGAPELVTNWYVEHGYDFLVLSDHNVLSQGERWIAVSDAPRSRLTPAQLEELRSQFGADWPTLRQRDGQTEMRLKTLGELRARFAKPNAFLMIQGEEITDSYERAPVHVNGLHVRDVIPPQGGDSVRDTMQRNIDAVIAQSEQHDQPMLAHVNHPNFGWAMTVEDIASIRGERFFEVYNGHPSVRNAGDSAHPSMEQMWDLALTHRLTRTDLGVLFGVATDDAHNYHEHRVGRANPGRGWVVVRAEALEPNAIIEAMQRGDFYASSGVTLSDVRVDEDSYRLDIDREPGLVYTTQFIGTRRGAGGAPVGEVLLETTANPAVYRFKGDELYVRAKVTSSRLHPNPYAAGDHEVAWTQPVVR